MKDNAVNDYTFEEEQIINFLCEDIYDLEEMVCMSSFNQFDRGCFVCEKLIINVETYYRFHHLTSYLYISCHMECTRDTLLQYIDKQLVHVGYTKCIDKNLHQYIKDVLFNEYTEKIRYAKINKIVLR